MTNPEILKDVGSQKL